MDSEGVKSPLINNVDKSQMQPLTNESIFSQLNTATNIKQSLWEQLTSNPLFTGGLGLAGLGAGLRYGQQGLRGAASLIRRRMLVDIEITRHDASYPWILNWMTRQYQQQLSSSSSLSNSASFSTSSISKPQSLFSRFISLISPRLHHLQISTTRLSSTASDRQSTNSNDDVHFSLLPGQGTHLLRHNNTFISISRDRNNKSFDTHGTPFETIKLTTLYSQRSVFESIFSEAYSLAKSNVEGKTIIYTLSNMQWMPLGEPRRKRPLGSVVLDRGLAEKVLSDVQQFLTGREWYLDRGIPYRRGYLLHGPPGTGKTSFVQALAGELGWGIGMLSLSQRGLHDDLLNRLLLNVPPKTIVLLEDCDAAFVNRRQSGEDGYTGANVTFSGLLNALDGVTSAEERIVFMTTNHVEKLDDALIRPGRVDMMVNLGNASEWQIGQMWDRFYDEKEVGEMKRRQFIQAAVKFNLVGNISTAGLQMVFLDNKGSADGAMRMLEELAKSRT